MPIYSTEFIEDIRKARKEGKQFFRAKTQQIADFLLECLETGLTKKQFKIFVSTFNTMPAPFQNLEHWIEKSDSKRIGGNTHFKIEELMSKIKLNAGLLKDKEVQKVYCQKIFDRIMNYEHNQRRYEIELIQFEEYFEREIKDSVEGGSQDNLSRNPEFTLHRQCLAFYYLMKYSNVRMVEINKTDIARFIQFMTGREGNNPNISNTNIYKTWKTIFNKEEKRNIQDLIFIKGYFEKLGLTEVIKMIENDMDITES